MQLWTLWCMYLFKLLFLILSDIQPEVELLSHIVVLFLIFWDTSILFSTGLHWLTFPPIVYKGSLFSKSTPIYVICRHFFPFIFISWRLISLQYCSGFCHTLTWISHGFTCIPHPNTPSHLPPHPIPLGPPSAPAPSTCLMHPTWAGDLFHPW